MKSSDRPEISKKWWSAEKPDDVKGADLEKALAAAEKALADEEKQCDDRSIGTCLKALGDLSAAVDKTVKKELDKKKHKDPIAVLGKFDALIGGEVKRLEAAQAKLQESGEEDGDEDEESDEKIFQPEYVHKMVKLLKSTGKELNFGFGLDTKNPEASKLVITRKGKPERLFKALKKTGDFSNRLITYGTALADPQDGKTLVFKLAESAGEPPQVLKLGRRFLRSDKGLRFRKLKLILPGGQTFEDTEPDTEDAEPAVGAGPTPQKEAGTGPGSAGGRRLTPEDRERIRKEIEQIEKRLDEVSVKEPATI